MYRLFTEIATCKRIRVAATIAMDKETPAAIVRKIVADVVVALAAVAMTDRSAAAQTNVAANAASVWRVAAIGANM